MHKFDYNFLDNGLLPARLVTLSSNIYSLKTLSGVRLEEYADLFEELEKIARVQSVKSSNEIEGIITTDERIRDIVNRDSAPLNHSEAEIAGYRDALNRVHTTYDTLSLSEETLLSLHETMLTPSGSAEAGRYKSEDNVIAAIDASGRRHIRFRPIAANETPDAMEQFVLAYMDARANSNINQILLIPCVVLDFLCIHPFLDGNGRLSRLLSLLLLYRSGFDAGKYISFEEQINQRKDAYYDALQRSSDGWHENENDYFVFVENFLSTLYLCYKELDKRFAIVRGKKVTKTERIEAYVLNAVAPVSKADICDILPDISPTTVEYVLGTMVKDGRVTKVGGGRLVRYVKA